VHNGRRGNFDALGIQPIKEPIMTMHAKGPFDVKLAPQPLAVEDQGEGTSRGRMSLDKQYHGDLEAASKGEMLTAGTGVKGSAGYVAIEHVTGRLQGLAGGFVLQHNGVMTRGDGKLAISVVPDSGTGQLAGLTGTLTIRIEDGKHYYDFAYELPDGS
jgi:hypothetical protein